jgi:hypothetical protein
VKPVFYIKSKDMHEFYLFKKMNYPAASERGINRNKFLIAASSGVLNSFIPIRFAIGIRSTYIFQFTPFLKYEFHE